MGKIFMYLWMISYLMIYFLNMLPECLDLLTSFLDMQALPAWGSCNNTEHCMALGGTFVLVKLKYQNQGFICAHTLRGLFSQPVLNSGIGILDRKQTFQYSYLETSVAYFELMKYFTHQNDVLCTNCTCIQKLR